MLLATLILLAGSPSRGASGAAAIPLRGVVWRCRDEVYRIEAKPDRMVLTTSGGVVERYASGRIRDVEPPAGAVPRKTEGPSAQAGNLLSYWGARRFMVRGPNGEHPGPERPPADGDYALAQTSEGLWAGTNQGLWLRKGDDAWRRVLLPSELPMARVQGLAFAGGAFVVGGLSGLFVGRPGDWKEVSKEPVREIAGQGGSVWVLYGSGAVDKLVPGQDRLYPDVFFGAAKRPWASHLVVEGERLFATGHGGWIERDGERMTERYPEALKDQVVTAILPDGAARWVGTQDGALFRFEGDRVQRWTPAHGLEDPWITALCKTPSGVLAGTWSGGLYRVEGDRVERIATPGDRVRQLAYVNGRLVLGLADGAYLRRGRGWTALDSKGEETTGLAAIRERLAILTASGVHFR